jgi:hypothetical protein
MPKLTITCQSFHPLRRNTLYGFAEILIRDMHLSVKDVAVHEKNGKRWAQLPSKPLIGKDGVALKDETSGKTRYASLMQFTNREIADAFSNAVVRAVLEHEPGAFDSDASTSARPQTAGTSKRVAFDDEVPFAAEWR